MFASSLILIQQFLAEDGMDTDMPSKLELLVLSNVFGKAFFAYLQRIRFFETRLILIVPQYVPNLLLRSSTWIYSISSSHEMDRTQFPRSIHFQRSAREICGMERNVVPAHIKRYGR